MRVPHPVVEQLGGNRYRLFQDYVYEWEKENSYYRLVVPVDFECDMASVPRILWFLISPFDLGPAALPHDWIYSKSGRLPPGSWQTKRQDQWEEDGRIWSREDADRLFGRMMREVRVSKLKRRSAYLAVRIFGCLVWMRSRHRKRAASAHSQTLI